MSKPAAVRFGRCGVGALVVLFAFASGCGKSYDGPQRYEVSGTVTYQGKPVPKGFIRFVPDRSIGNRGSGGGAPIIDGQYATSEAKGVVGGPHLVTVTGTDGVPYAEYGEEIPDGRQLFPTYQLQFDFPKEDTDWDVDVPEKIPSKQTSLQQYMSILFHPVNGCPFVDI